MIHYYYVGLSVSSRFFREGDLPSVKISLTTAGPCNLRMLTRNPIFYSTEKRHLNRG